LVRDLLFELKFLVSRSSGPGGQNVNKVNTKVTLKWDAMHSAVLSEGQRELIRRKLSNRLTSEGTLLLSAQDQRSQLKNKEEVLGKLEEILEKAFAIQKKRRPTKPGKAARLRRIKEKKIKSEKKQWRQRP
jgi:ribosome-associated protein